MRAHLVKVGALARLLCKAAGHHPGQPRRPALRLLIRERDLEALDLGANALTRGGPDSIVVLAGACAVNEGLRRLDISGSGIDAAPGPRMAFLEPAAVAVARCLDENPRLRTVRL